MNVDEKRIARKISVRLVIPLLILLFLSSVDRVNVSFAALQMNADLGLSAQSYGFGVSVFFFGYILLQLPSIWLLQKIGMRRWVCCIALLWGLAATGMAFIQTKEQFYFLRLVLGIAEGGYAPGLVWYLSRWMPSRYRGGAIATAMLAVPISVIAGGPLSGWLMSIDNPVDWPGWRWMFLVEGLPTIILAFAALRIFADEPKDAAWLSDVEARWITDQLMSERKTQTQSIRTSALLASPRMWAAAACWFALMAGAYGVIYWLPQVIRHLSSEASDIEVSVLSALPWVAAGIGMILNSWHSDRTQERYLHVAVASLGAGAFMLLAGVSGGAAAFLFLMLSALCMGGGQSTFWTVPPTFLSAAAGATGIAVINICGNAAGLVVPALIGWIRERTGSFDVPVFAMAAIFIVGGGALLLIRPRAGAEVALPTRVPSSH